MNRRDWLVCGLVVFGSVVLLGGYFRWDRQLTTGAIRIDGETRDTSRAVTSHNWSSDGARELRELRAEVDNLARQVKLLTAVASLRSALPDTGNEPLTQGENEETEPPEAQAALARAAAEAYFAELGTALDRESRDPAWAEEVQSRVSDVLANDFANEVYAREVTCRSTLCRVVVDGADERSIDHFRTFFTGAVRKELPKATSTMAGDSVVFYLSRAGHELPER